MSLSKNIFKGDIAVWVIFMLLCLISFIEVYSAASMLIYKTGDQLAPLKQHSEHLVMGAFIVFIVQNIPLKLIRKVLTPFALLVAFVLLVLVLIKGEQINDASRWLSIFGFSFQPSEIAKLAVIMTTASILGSMQEENNASPKAFKYIVYVTLVFCGLIFFENLSTSVLLGMVVFMMMIIGRIPMKYIGMLVLVVALAGFAFFTFLRVTPNETLEKIPMGHRFVTWKGRFFDHTKNNTKPLSPEDFKITDDNRQAVHANIAIASSNFIGRAPGNSIGRDFLPQAFSDFIYAIILEELGFEGGLIVIVLYIWLLIRAGKIAGKCDKDYPAFLVMGVALMIVAQAMFNMLVAVGIVPVTGQPLPLISRGGTSTLINCIYIGLILSVSRYNNLCEATAKAMQEGDMEEVRRLEEVNADSNLQAEDNQ